MSSFSNEDEYYSIESILGKRIHRGAVQYLIKWQGYEKNESTWEPLENLENAMSTVMEYEEEQSVKSCSTNEIEILGAEPTPEGNIIVLLKTKVADRVFKFDSTEIAQKWPQPYIDFLEKHVKFRKRTGK